MLNIAVREKEKRKAVVLRCVKQRPVTRFLSNSFGKESNLPQKKLTSSDYFDTILCANLEKKPSAIFRAARSIRRLPTCAGLPPTLVSTS